MPWMLHQALGSHIRETVHVNGKVIRRALSPISNSAHIKCASCKADSPWTKTGIESWSFSPRSIFVFERSHALLGREGVLLQHLR